YFFFFSSRRRHTRWPRDWSSDVCSSDLVVNHDRRAPGRAAVVGNTDRNTAGSAIQEAEVIDQRGIVEGAIRSEGKNRIAASTHKIGRASCRERGENSEEGVTLQMNTM